MLQSLKPFAVFVFAVTALLGDRAYAKQVVAALSSPEGRVSADVRVLKSGETYLAARGPGLNLDLSRLGVEVDGEALSPVEFIGQEASQHRSRVETAWGKCSSYDNHYHEVLVSYRTTDERQYRYDLRLRVFDSAIAFRYEFPDAKSSGEPVRLTSELTAFNFGGPRQATGNTFWSYNGENEPLGPFPMFDPPVKKLRLPLTIKHGADGYAAIIEGATFEQAPMSLEVTNSSDMTYSTYEAKAPESTITTGHTSWRVILLGDTPGDLLTGPAPYVLNTRCEFDASWVQPGLAFWDWRAWGAKTDDGFTYGLDMASWRRFIDFAAENNIKYLVLDANWYGPEFEKTSDPRTSRDHLVYQPDLTKPQVARKPAPDDWEDPIDVPAIIAYGRERGVGVILYINDIARLNYPFEETLALYEKWGAAGIKYGFMEGKGQQKVLDTREIVRLCAKHHLLCDFHDGPVPPSGDERTFPNYVTREFCHAQADSMRSFTPGAFCKTVFVNMLAGPLDMNNGFFTLENPARDRPRVFQNIDSTVVAEAARVLITYTGLAILPDTPEAYAAKGDLFAFIRRLPMDWDETRILSGEIGEHITTARRSGEVWFLASATNEQGRKLTTKLDFLDPGRRYKATLYRDHPDAHYQTNREAYVVEKAEYASDDELLATLAPGGGFCAILEPAD